MQHYNIFKQEEFGEIVDLIRSQSTCQLITLSDKCVIQIGIFNPLYLDEKVYLHLHRKDPQVESIAASGKCRLVFQDILVQAPMLEIIGVPTINAQTDLRGIARIGFRWSELTL